MRKKFIPILIISFLVFLPISPVSVHAQTIPLNISFEPVVTGLNNPLYITHAGDGSDRLFIVQNNGKILIFKNGALKATPFLDVSSVILSGGERGLLGLAFPADYETSGYFYISYTSSPNGNVELARYSVSNADSDVADASSRVVLISIPKALCSGQPCGNHNGGMITFGPDGYLYFAVGDGGGGGDPYGNGQNINSLLGKILRLDVSGDDFPADSSKNYAIPSSNPFVGVDGSDEIWAYGLRNPWRFSFDKDTGDIFIGDVGQGQYEEINFQSAASAGGENYGWNTMEGNHCYSPSTGCDTSGKIAPIAEYTHSTGCSVTGGYIYRGTQFTALQGVYLYADYCQGILFGLSKNTNNQWQATTIKDTSYNITSFGESEDGELYFTDYSTGSVYHITKSPTVISTYKSEASLDGFVVESGESTNIGYNKNPTANILRAGDDTKNRQIKSIISFNTSSLPDSITIISAQILLTKYNQIGQPDNGSLGTLIADIRKTKFSTLTTLEGSDFQALASLKKAANIVTLIPSDGIYQLNLNPSSFNYINRSGRTQFRVSFTVDDNNNYLADQLIFYSGNYTTDPSYVPQLVIEYSIP